MVGKKYLKWLALAVTHELTPNNPHQASAIRAISSENNRQASVWWSRLHIRMTASVTNTAPTRLETVKADRIELADRRRSACSDAS